MGTPRLLLCSLLAAGAACLESPRYTRAPADASLSIGVVRDTGRIPQSSSAVRLRFLGGTPGPGTIAARRVDQPLRVDGDDADWAGIPASEVPLLGPGPILGMTEAQWYAEHRAEREAAGACAPAPAPCDLPPWDYGLARVSVRAAYDDATLWILLQWEDATESRTRRPWTWSAAGGAWVQDRAVDQDRAFLSFEVDGSFPLHGQVGCAAACHVKRRLGEVTPEARADRFRMHTLAAGQRVDGWAWGAAASDRLGLADDETWDQVTIRGDCPDPAEEPGKPACTLACAAGAAPPCSLGMEVQNRGGTPAQPLWMGEGGVNSDPAALFLDGAGAPAAVALDPAGARDGARLPGTVLRRPAARRDEVRARGAWRAGTWTVEFARALVTGDPQDAQFPLR